VKRLGKLPGYNAETWSPRFDPEGLVRLLNHARRSEYIYVDQPDVRDRNRPQPDFLFCDSKLEKRIAIEHLRWISPPDAETSSMAKKGLNPRPVGRAKLRVNGLTSLRALPNGLGVVTTWDGDESLAHLEREILRKLRKGQLSNIESDEKVLLVNGGIWIPERISSAVEVNITSELRKQMQFFFVSDYASIWAM
jgi:hypothetical protein